MRAAHVQYQGWCAAAYYCIRAAICPLVPTRHAHLPNTAANAQARGACIRYVRGPEEARLGLCHASIKHCHVVLKQSINGKLPIKKIASVKALPS